MPSYALHIQLRPAADADKQTNTRSLSKQLCCGYILILLGFISKKVIIIKTMVAFSVIVGSMLAVLFVLCSISATVRFYVKLTYYYSMIWVCASLPLPVAAITPFEPTNSLIPSALLLISVKILGLKWKVYGADNIDRSRGCVVMMNHQSAMDLIPLAVINPITPRRMVVAKNSLKYLVPFGTAIWLWGTLFISRGAQSARNTLNQQVTAVKDKKRQLFVFPEGTRGDGKKLLPFRKGGFHVAVNAGAPIQPIVISRYYFVDYKKKTFDAGDIVIKILPLIETTKYTVDDIPNLVEKTQNQMQDTYDEISAEVVLSNVNSSKKAL